MMRTITPSQLALHCTTKPLFFVSSQQWAFDALNGGLRSTFQRIGSALLLRSPNEQQSTNCIEWLRLCIERESRKFRPSSEQTAAWLIIVVALWEPVEKPLHQLRQKEERLQGWLLAVIRIAGRCLHDPFFKETRERRRERRREGGRRDEVWLFSAAVISTKPTDAVPLLGWWILA